MLYYFLTGSHVMSAVKPLEVQVLSSKQPISAERTYEVQCQAVGSKPSANITWWKDNERLTNVTQSVSKAVIRPLSPVEHVLLPPHHP